MYFYDCTIKRYELDEGLDEILVIVRNGDFQGGDIRLPTGQARLVAAEMLRLCDEIESVRD